MNTINNNEIAKGIVKGVLSLAGIALVLYFCYQISSIFWYIAIATVLSIIGRPLVSFLNEKLKLSSSISAAITILVFILFFVGIIFLLTPLISDQIEILANIKQKDIENLINRNIVFLQFFIDLEEQTINSFLEEHLQNFINVEKISSIFNKIFSSTFSIIINAFSILFLAFFFLKDRELFYRGVLSFTPDKNEARVGKVIDSIKVLLSRYFLGLILQVLIMFFLYLSILLVFGIDNAVIIALICGFLNLIPYVGPVLGYVVITLFSTNIMFSEGLNFEQEILPKLLWISIAYFIVQMIDNFLSQPIIYSNTVKAHPLEIFLVIIAGGLLFGLIGVIIAVPVYTAIRVILKEFFFEFKVVKSITKDI